MVEGIVGIVIDAVLLIIFVAVTGLSGMAWFGEPKAPTSVRRSLAVGWVLSLIVLGGALGAVIVPAGNIGVVTVFGKIDNETLKPGIHFRMPFVNNVHMITTRVQPHQFDEIDAASSEYQSVKLTGIMNYHIDGQFAADLYQRVGDDFAAKVLDPAFNDYIKSVTPDYSITEILNKRDEIRRRAKEDLQANLAQYHIIIDDIYIANIAFSPEYTAAIEAKQVAAQQVETEKQVLAQRSIQAQQAVIKAKGEADAAIETAKGQAEANRLLTESLSDPLIRYTLIKQLGPTINTVILPDNQSFILDSSIIKP